MEKEFPVQMRFFYSLKNHRKGNTPGNAFTGKVLRTIMEPGSLEELSQLLGPPGDLWVNYLSSLQQLYKVCVMRELDPAYSYEEAFYNFHDAFDLVHEEHGLSETLKVFCFFTNGI